MSIAKVLKNGILDENPAFRLVLGMCPALAVTTSAINGLGMGISTMAVLLGSNVVISLLRNIIPKKVRIPAFITIIAGFVTIIQLLLKAYVPALDEALGIFIPLIVVNCVILSRAEAFASKNKLSSSILDAVAMGLGFTFALFILGATRELLGNATLLGFSILGESISPALAMLLPPGGFLTFGIIMGIINKFSSVKLNPTGCSGCPGGCKKFCS